MRFCLLLTLVVQALAQRAPEFEVASVRPSNPDNGFINARTPGLSVDGARNLIFAQTTLRDLIMLAYGVGAPLKGPIPLDQALLYARQITSALEAAHDKAITHRDLKPGNIMLKPDGVIKVLDFGLAKFGGPSPTSISQDSPTLSMAATVAGTILGTAAYMAPEQARGKEVDKRADIWAFGVVLHEMLTGERLFKGEDLTETMAAVVMREPDLSPMPHEVRRLLKKCLQKDPAKRLRDIGDAWELLDQAPVEAAPVGQITPASKLPWIASAVGIVAAVAFAGLYFTRSPQPVAAEAVRFTIDPAPGTVLNTGGPNRTNAVPSPDGRYIAFLVDEAAANGATTRMLWVRELKSLSAQKLEKTEGASEPFWSPDSKNIAFSASDGKLKRISVSGGAPINLADVTAFEGGTWFQPPGAEADGTILYAVTDATGIRRIPASGGVPTLVTKLGKDEGHMAPQFLPDGKRFLYFVRGGAKPGIYVQSLGSGSASDERKFLLATTSRAMFAPPDYLLFLRDNTLLSQHVDWSTPQMLGEAVAVTDGVRTGGSNGRNGFSVSSTGTLVYRAGGTNDSQFRWFTRDGKEDGPGIARMDSNAIEISPDNKRAIVERRTGGTADLWLVELASGLTSRLTSDPGNEGDAVWSPDSRRIAFLKQGDKVDVYQMLIGSGKDSLVIANVPGLEAWTRDGLLVRTGGKVSLIPALEEAATAPLAGTPKVLFEEKFTVDQFHPSPDGKWVVYMSRESGDSEIWVASFPGFTDRRKVSAGYGESPLWRGDGKEIFFLSAGDAVSAVDVTAGATFQAGSQRLLFRAAGATPLNYNYIRWAVTKDGKRFLIRQTPDVNTSEVERLFVILNWPALGK